MLSRRHPLFHLLAVLCLLWAVHTPSASAQSSNNLLIDGGFERGFSYWTVAAGQPETVTTTSGPVYAGTRSLWLGDYNQTTTVHDRIDQYVTKPSSYNNVQNVCFMWYLRSNDPHGYLDVKVVKTIPNTTSFNLGSIRINSETAARYSWQYSCFSVDSRYFGGEQVLVLVGSSTTGGTGFFVDNLRYEAYHLT